MFSPKVYSCRHCGAAAIWHPERQVVACGACGTALDLPAPPSGAAGWFPLLERLRDGPQKRRLWTPAAFQAICPCCGESVTFPGGFTSHRCDACGAPLLRGAEPGDAPLVPDGVVPFSIGETGAAQRLRTWAASTDGGRFSGVAIENVELRRTYVAYWQFSVHVHCPFRGGYGRERDDGSWQQVEYDGLIDEPYDGTERAFDSVDPASIEAFEPMALDQAAPFDTRYLAGATVEAYSIGLRDAWDAVHARIDAQVDSLLRMAGDGSSLPSEMWPTWKDHRGRLVLVPVYVVSCVSVDRVWSAMIHGATGKVVGKPPLTAGQRRFANVVIVLMAALAIAAVVLAWRFLYWLFTTYPPRVPFL